ncbi:EAL domain-containing protein [Cyanobium sp. ATX 6F1]|uniref:sensor domain-containing phosphodiesterase n=1 Tax=unclassified Cyanobium TaxID=2627006 RepID=UPI0020CFB55A|nr:EAL domain-containing protein [Cyanobium sp. ATX 6F1]MCP9917127.1 EAL domain-containing protein [Cyanobium sp. ATX 6F1]
MLNNSGKVSSSQASNTMTSDDLEIHFQPIISLKTSAVIGLEALARPLKMNVEAFFSEARQSGKLLELDRRCRALAMAGFRNLSQQLAQQPLLFLQFETSLIDEGAEGSEALMNATKEAGLEPNDIVIELKETRAMNSMAIKNFVDNYRELGFLIAIDDVGSGYSNLTKISELRPHIIKLDRCLVEGVEKSYIKQETIKSLVHLSKNIGTLVLAEGIETQAELDYCAYVGINYFQGHYFARPAAPTDLHLSDVQLLILKANHRHRAKVIAAQQAQQQSDQDLQAMAIDCSDRLRSGTPTEFDPILAAWVLEQPSINAAYLLDNEGVQLSKTHLGRGVRPSQHRLFAPATPGTDHSNKEYFLGLIENGPDQFLTNSYIDLATGRLCRTLARQLNIPDGGAYVLCIDQLTPNTV